MNIQKLSRMGTYMKMNAYFINQKIKNIQNNYGIYYFVVGFLRANYS